MATDLSLALEQIDALRKAVAQLQDGGDTALQRKKACALAHNLSVALEDPGDMVDRILNQARI